MVLMVSHIVSIIYECVEDKTFLVNIINKINEFLTENITIKELAVKIINYCHTLNDGVYGCIIANTAEVVCNIQVVKQSMLHIHFDNLNIFIFKTEL